MAGFITKHLNYAYPGEWVNGAAQPVPNGLLMVQGTGDDVDKLVLPGAADTDSKFVCIEDGTIYDGMPAKRFVVDKLAKRYYFVDCEFDINDSMEYDKRTYTTDVGKYLRVHPLEVGEELWSDCITGTIAKGATPGVKADGTIG